MARVGALLHGFQGLDDATLVMRWGIAAAEEEETPRRWERAYPTPLILYGGGSVRRCPGDVCVRMAALGVQGQGHRAGEVAGGPVTEGRCTGGVGRPLASIGR